MRTTSVAAVAILLIGCAPDADPVEPEPRSQAPSLVEDFAVSTGLAFLDCGELSCTNDIAARPTGYEAEFTCILDAYTACTAARFDYATQTEEGDFFYEHFFVIPTEPGCRIEYFADSTDDCYGAGELIQRSASLRHQPETGGCEHLAAAPYVDHNVLYEFAPSSAECESRAQ